MLVSLELGIWVLFARSAEVEVLADDWTKDIGELEVTLVCCEKLLGEIEEMADELDRV